MSWQAGLVGLALTCSGFCALVVIAAKLVTRKNRRVALPAPKYDERNSIAAFKRMHQP